MFKYHKVISILDINKRYLVIKMYGRRYSGNNEYGERYERDCEKRWEYGNMDSRKGCRGSESGQYGFHEHMHEQGECHNEERRCRHEQHRGCHGGN